MRKIRIDKETQLTKEVIDAASSNLSVLKSPTVLRLEDGSFYGWEGVFEKIFAFYTSDDYTKTTIKNINDINTIIINIKSLYVINYPPRLFLVC